MTCRAVGRNIDTNTQPTGQIKHESLRPKRLISGPAAMTATGWMGRRQGQCGGGDPCNSLGLLLVVIYRRPRRTPKTSRFVRTLRHLRYVIVCIVIRQTTNATTMYANVYGDLLVFILIFKRFLTVLTFSDWLLVDWRKTSDCAVSSAPSTSIMRWIVIAPWLFSTQTQTTRAGIFYKSRAFFVTDWYVANWNHHRRYIIDKSEGYMIPVSDTRDRRNRDVYIQTPSKHPKQSRTPSTPPPPLLNASLILRLAFGGYEGLPGVVFRRRPYLATSTLLPS